MLSYVGGASGNDDHHSTKYVYAITTTAEFQTVESAYRQGTYDRCLYYALQLLNRYPENAYLISRIGKIFLDLHTIKSHNIPAFDNLVSRYTPYYTEELTLINNLLHNLTAKELGEVGYYFLSNSKNFNPSEKSHYYLLWKLSDLTYRNEMREKFKQDYKSTFGESITVFVYK